MLYTESMHYFFTVFFFVFGSLLGSFSNVVVLRMAIGTSVIFPPSHCPKCNHRLSVWDLFPIFSWLFLRGKCRYCKAPISVQYPLGESFMALIIGLSFFKTGPGLDLICLASGMAIWFVVSEIFIRGEVTKFQPFIWAVVYSIVLRFFMVGRGMFDAYFLLVIILALLVGVIASIKTFSPIEFISWFCVSFLPFMYLPYSLIPYSSALLLLTAFFNSSKPKARWVFFGLQIIAILLNIYFTKTTLLFIDYIG